KGSLTAIQAAEMMKKAILAVQPQKEVIKKPMADGGEGTTDSLLSATPGDMVSIDCTGPLGQQKSTSYAIIGGDTAVIECAKIAGLADVPLSKRNPDYTTTYGIDRKSTRLNSSHVSISYAVFCLKKKKKNNTYRTM